ncbi:MAG: ABC transporter permease [Sphingomicrobium sp.]
MTDQASPGGAAESLIVPAGRWPLPRLGEVARSADLLGFFVWRDVKTRYSQTVFGVGWAVIQPITTMLVFWVVFGRLIGVESYGIPYPLFCLAGLVVWNLFSQGMTNAAGSVVAHQNQITKIYFPRLIIPLAAIGVVLVDFLIGLALLLCLLLWEGVSVGPQILLAPLFVIMAAAVATGVGAALGALNVLYRDIRHLVGFLAQIWLFATPVAYPANLIPAKWQWLAGFNPMAGIVEGFRWTVLGTPLPSPALLALSLVTSLVVLVGGIILFSAIEDKFADLI